MIHNILEDKRNLNIQDLKKIKKHGKLKLTFQLNIL